MTVIAAAVSLPLYYRLWLGDWRALVKSAELCAYLVLLLLSCALLSLLYSWTAGASAAGTETCLDLFHHGDGGKPAILKEAGPGATDNLFCLTGNDQTNIIASLIGRSLGFEHTVTKINDAEFEHVCLELGLENTIIPSRTIGRYLADMLQGESPLALSAMIRGDARVTSFIAREEDAVPVSELGLPDDCRVMFLYRAGEFIIADADTALKEGDGVALITRDKQLEKLRERWQAL